MEEVLLVFYKLDCMEKFLLIPIFLLGMILIELYLEEFPLKKSPHPLLTTFEVAEVIEA